jgi:ABC-type oligopeptide transport system substrate-binding subunit
MFYAETLPPPVQEFRWSNGGSPRSFDPARAAAAPETDVVRAIYEGLTEIDTSTLEAVPAVAESWESSPDLRTWTFTIRENAKWSNGMPVTAHDFVRSWKRLAELGDKAAHPFLAANIVGMANRAPQKDDTDGEPGDFLRNIQKGHSNTEDPADTSNSAPTGNYRPGPPSNAASSASDNADPKLRGRADRVQEFGVSAESDTVLKVKLTYPDKDLPRLVANPVFRPIFGTGNEFDSDGLNAKPVTNGAFALSSVGPDGIALERSKSYWNIDAVSLERVRFVPKSKAEDALRAYRDGEIDAVTNASFEPLVLKLLAPYDDFRKNTFSALNYYKVNAEKPPFGDRRVREALAISIDRDRLTDGELEGSTRPALSFLPFDSGTKSKLVQDKDRARELLEDAGFPDGVGFPMITLVVNRNDTQQRVARSVARMWKEHLNLDTEIAVKGSGEIDEAIRSREFDIVRRGVVLPAADETVSIMAMFERGAEPAQAKDERRPASNNRSTIESPTTPLPAGVSNSGSENTVSETDEFDEDEIFTEENALYELHAIPLYFPTSYSLVKPYVLGFEMNILDAPVLKNVRIDNRWTPGMIPGSSR